MAPPARHRLRWHRNVSRGIPWRARAARLTITPPAIEKCPAGHTSAATSAARVLFMSKITYQIVQHDGGWAYRAQGTYSETFPTHEAARQAVLRVAREQTQPGESTAISW